MRRAAWRGAHGFVEDNFFRPIPSFENLDELNIALAAFCERDLLRTQTGQSQTVGERYAHEKRFLGALPAVLPRTCVMRSARIDKFSEIAFESNWYSAPTRYAHRDAVIEVYERRIRIIVGDEAVAQHPRGFGKGEHFLDVRHYLNLLQHKHRAAETALVLSEGRIPPNFALSSSTTAKPIHGPRPNAGRASWDCSSTLHSTNLLKP